MASGTRAAPWESLLHKLVDGESLQPQAPKSLGIAPELVAPAHRAGSGCALSLRAGGHHGWQGAVRGRARQREGDLEEASRDRGAAIRRTERTQGGWGCAGEAQRASPLLVARGDHGACRGRRRRASARPPSSSQAPTNPAPPHAWAVRPPLAKRPPPPKPNPPRSPPRPRCLLGPATAAAAARALWRGGGCAPASLACALVYKILYLPCKKNGLGNLGVSRGFARRPEAFPLHFWSLHFAVLVPARRSAPRARSGKNSAAQRSGRDRPPRRGEEGGGRRRARCCHSPRDARPPAAPS